jgi:hypothetical protein
LAKLKKLLNYTSKQTSISAKFQSASQNRKLFDGQLNRLFSKRTKIFITITIVALILVSLFAFMPKVPQTSSVPTSTDTPTSSPNTTSNLTNSTPTVTPAALNPITKIIDEFSQIFVPLRNPGIVESAKTINATTWLDIAIAAWKYYQPGVGVYENNGLPGSAIDTPSTTDWDLGVYIQAVLDAKKLGLIDYNGTWGFNDRINKILTFLETRELNNASYPYWFYTADDGKVLHEISDEATSDVDIVDTGRLFVALNNLRNFDNSDPTIVTRVNNYVYNTYGNRSNYAALVDRVKSDGMTTTSMYAYYVYSGFASFWPNQLSGTPSQIMTNIFSSGNVSINGVKIPKCTITGDVIFGALFDTTNNDSRLIELANLVAMAHEAYYNQTGNFRAFGEGPQLSSVWQWEWIVFSDGRIWTSLNVAGQVVTDPPFIYTKIALSLLAIYNTNYTRSMCIFLEQKLAEPTRGYGWAVTEDGKPFNGVGTHTNGLILGAARYFIQNNPPS